MFSFEIITLILATVFNALVFWLVVTEGWKVVVNRYFAVGILAAVFWAIGTIIFLTGSNNGSSQFGLMLFYVAPMFTIWMLSVFASGFPDKNGRVFSVLNSILGVITVLFAAVIVAEPGLLTESVTRGDGGYNKLDVNATGFPLYMAYFNAAFMMAFGGFIVQIRRHKGRIKKQLVFIFIGTFATAILSLLTNLILPQIGYADLIWLGPTWTLLYVTTVTVSIVKHQLFDIKLAAVRGLAYICVLVALSMIYYIAAYFVSIFVFGAQTSQGVSVSPVNIVLALLLAFLFQPIRHFFDKATNKIFYRDAYNSDEFFAELGELLASTTDLRGLLERAAREIATTLKSEQSFFYLSYTTSSSHYMSAGTKKHALLPYHDAQMLQVLAASHSEDIIATEFLTEKDENVRRMLLSHKIALIMPLRLRRGNKVIGYLCLGEHRTGGYSKRDLKVLMTISDQLIVAIQNALSVHEVREINASLHQRIDVATKELRESNAQLHRLDAAKDEFVSMASHQLRTPLTSIKGYISIILDGDVGEINARQRNALEEAFNNSERMVRLIGDFLSVSRLQTGKFSIERQPTDLAKVVGQEVDALRIIASTHGQKISYIPPKNLPIVYIDEPKIRQVVMNFIDNAIYYARSDSTIHVSLGELDRELVFTVEDSGIGVPKEQQGKLFTKFYRASNAREKRPDGTGVGLFLAKKVITEHKGKVVFSSIEGQGSTFGFRIPLDKETSQADDHKNDDK